MLPPQEKETNDNLIDISTGTPLESEKGRDKLLHLMDSNLKSVFRSYLIQLMAIIIRWKLQPTKRNRKMLVQIVNLRIELNILREECSFINKEYIAAIWDRSYADALKVVSAETGIRNIGIPQIGFEDIFENEFVYTKLN